MATRERVALFDITPFAKFDVAGPDALAFLERVFANRIDRPVGSLVYTAALTPRGGIRLDLTIARKEEELFRVVTGGGSGQHDLAWLRAQLREDERVTITERTGSLFALGLWGPSAREVLEAVTEADVSNDAFPYMTAKYLHVGEVGPVWAQRISYAGELGWELTVDAECAVGVWDALVESGRDHGMEPIGYRALDGLRMEKGYRYYSVDMTMLETPYEAGLGPFVRPGKGDFIGRDVLHDAGRPDRILTTLLVGDDQAYLPIYGGEAVRADGVVIGRLRSVAYGPTVERMIGYVYRRRDLSDDARLTVDVFDDQVPATIAPDVLWDPDGTRMRG